MKRNSKSALKSVVVSLLLIALCFVFMAVSSAQAASLHTVYSAKFSCGNVADDSKADVVKGRYLTAVNIHNPNMQTVQFKKLAVIALAERETAYGAISNTVSESLGPEQAIYVDCTDIKTLFPTSVALPAHYEGFVEISVPYSPTGAAVQLDVWAKYTARHRTSAVVGADPTNTDVESFNVVEVPGKKISK